WKAVARTISATFGYARLASSMRAFTVRISSTSSMSPFGQELPLMTRCQPSGTGILLHGRPAAPGSADRARLARIRMDHDLGVRDLAGDEIDLGLDHRGIAMRAALQDEFPADRAQILQLTGIDPHVERQHGRQRRHDLVGRPALALLIDDVGLQENAAPHGELR